MPTIVVRGVVASPESVVPVGRAGGTAAAVVDGEDDVALVVVVVV